MSHESQRNNYLLKCKCQREFSNICLAPYQKKFYEENKIKQADYFEEIVKKREEKIKKKEEEEKKKEEEIQKKLEELEKKKLEEEKNLLLKEEENKKLEEENVNNTLNFNFKN